MSSHPKRLLSGIGAAVICLVAGCSNSMPTPTEQFKHDQKHTMTTHGRVREESVRELPGDELQYDNDDGTQWKVKYQRRSNGALEWGPPLPTTRP